VVVAQSKSKSLRTTIPAGIARQFGIDQETQLGWEIEARDNELRIVVRPVQNKNPLSQNPPDKKKDRRR
jgi:bifunctional DNA-binding transcriptional regulator/antitoxin component of YhaV-PrlF toxin-antitoxin module